MPTTTPSITQDTNDFPPGLVGDEAQFIFNAAPRSVKEIALAGAIAHLAGITGKAYNVSGTGLNQYILVVAETGSGKDAISDGIDSLNAAIKPRFTNIYNFAGPGDIVSYPAGVKELANKPSICCVIGEAGKKLKEMSAPNASPVLLGVSRFYLQAYSKSGEGKVLAPIVYSDREKNTAPVEAPALTIIGESNPVTFYAAVNEDDIVDGLLPRFLTFEYLGERPARNVNRQMVPKDELSIRVAALAKYAQDNIDAGRVTHVLFTDKAQSNFDEFDMWVDAKIRASKSEASRQQWNRVHLKALKLAALYAVGINHINPIIDMDAYLWATKLIVAQTNALIARVNDGETGEVAGSETKQLNAVIREIGNYLNRPFDDAIDPLFGARFDLHRDHIITQTYLSRKLIKSAAFKGSNSSGGTAALIKALKTLTDADDLRPIPKLQMLEKFETTAVAFVVVNPTRFLKDGK